MNYFDARELATTELTLLTFVSIKVYKNVSRRPGSGGFSVHQTVRETRGGERDLLVSVSVKIQDRRAGYALQCLSDDTLTDVLISVATMSLPDCRQNCLQCLLRS